MRLSYCRYGYWAVAALFANGTVAYGVHKFSNRYWNKLIVTWAN